MKRKVLLTALLATTIFALSGCGLGGEEKVVETIEITEAESVAPTATPTPTPSPTPEPTATPTPEPTPTPGAAPTDATVEATDSYLYATEAINIRSTYGTDGDILGSYEAGDTVHITGTVMGSDGQPTGWVQINNEYLETTDKIGYIITDLLTDVAPETTAAEGETTATAEGETTAAAEGEPAADATAETVVAE